MDVSWRIFHAKHSLPLARFSQNLARDPQPEALTNNRGSNPSFSLRPITQPPLSRSLQTVYEFIDVNHHRKQPAGVLSTGPYSVRRGGGGCSSLELYLDFFFFLDLSILPLPQPDAFPLPPIHLVSHPLSLHCIHLPSIYLVNFPPNPSHLSLQLPSHLKAPGSLLLPPVSHFNTALHWTLHYTNTSPYTTLFNMQNAHFPFKQT